MSTAPAIALVIIDCAALAASYWDVRYRSIPQWLVGIIAVAGVLAATLRSGWFGLSSAIGASALALLVTGLLYLGGLMGGGDVKFFAAISCAVGMERLLEFARMTGLLGILLAILYLAFGPPPFRNIRRGLPYGVAIATAGVITLTFPR